MGIPALVDGAIRDRNFAEMSFSEAVTLSWKSHGAPQRSTSAGLRVMMLAGFAMGCLRSRPIWPTARQPSGACSRFEHVERAASLTV